MDKNEGKKLVETLVEKTSGENEWKKTSGENEWKKTSGKTNGKKLVEKNNGKLVERLVETTSGTN